MSLSQVVARKMALSTPLQPTGRMLLSAVVKSTDTQASRDIIRRLFHSPLGVHVIRVARDHERLRLELDILAADLDLTLQMLNVALPEATLELIRPRTAPHRKH